MNNRGFSLIEVLIANAILLIVIGGAMNVFLVGYNTYEGSSSMIYNQAFLESKIERFIEQLMESRWTDVSISQINDPCCPTGQVSVITFPIARDQNGNFQVANGEASWQGVVAYCPFVNGGRCELRRYVNYGNHNYPLSVSAVTAAQITLIDGTIFQRSGGTVFFPRLERFDLTSGNPIGVAIRAQAADSKKRIIRVGFGQTGVVCRN